MNALKPDLVALTGDCRVRPTPSSPPCPRWRCWRRPSGPTPSWATTGRGTRRSGGAELAAGITSCATGGHRGGGRRSAPPAGGGRCRLHGVHGAGWRPLPGAGAAPWTGYGPCCARLTGAECSGLTPTSMVPGRQWPISPSGHTHGGQVRLPYVGALYLPLRDGQQVRGRLAGKAGPVYVNRGIGVTGIPRITALRRSS